MNIWNTSLIVGFLSLTTVTACSQKPNAIPEGSDGGDPAKKGEEAKEALVSEPCTRFAENLCEELQKDPASCKAAKQTLALVSDRACQAGITDLGVTKTKVASLAMKCEELAQKLCVGIGPESPQCDPIKRQLRKLPPAQCVELLDHVDEVVKGLKAERADYCMPQPSRASEFLCTLLQAATNPAKR
jgi:hypothetical protein